ncbi:ankyrin repeat-containing domain protein, partial [Mycena galopus ATCC 62051]
TPIHVAAVAGNVEIAQMLLDKGASMGVQCDTYGTGLPGAAKAGNIEIAQMLLDKGASTEAQCDQEECQPLHFAVIYKHLDMVRLLLDHGAPIDATFGCDGAIETALHCACCAGDLDTVKLLLERGAGLERPRGHDGTALEFAVRARKLDVVRFLVEKGADATVSLSGLLYSALDLIRPASDRYPLGWLPLSEEMKELMALFLAYGANKKTAVESILKPLVALAKVARHTQEEYLEVIAGMMREAEDAIPDLLQGALPLKTNGY